jgi:hypothetical protein
VVAGVATIGPIMAVLDTTIVNVALDTLSSDLHAPLGPSSGSRRRICCCSRR